MAPKGRYTSDVFAAVASRSAAAVREQYRNSGVRLACEYVHQPAEEHCNKNGSLRRDAPLTFRWHAEGNGYKEDGYKGSKLYGHRFKGTRMKETGSKGYTFKGSQFQRNDDQGRQQEYMQGYPRDHSNGIHAINPGSVPLHALSNTVHSLFGDQPGDHKGSHCGI